MLVETCYSIKDGQHTYQIFAGYLQVCDLEAAQEWGRKLLEQEQRREDAGGGKRTFCDFQATEVLQITASFLSGEGKVVEIVRYEIVPHNTLIRLTDGLDMKVQHGIAAHQLWRLMADGEAEQSLRMIEILKSEFQDGIEQLNAITMAAARILQP